MAISVLVHYEVFHARSRALGFDPTPQGGHKADAPLAAQLWFHRAKGGFIVFIDPS
jgi:hypothetical protein